MSPKESSPSDSDHSWSRHRTGLWLLISIALAGAVAAGIVVRLWMHFAQPPLWGDEVMLHMNLLHRSYRELAAPLSYGQMAPVLFLWLQKTAIVLFGATEQTVRIVPLLFGIATVGLVAAIVSRCCSWTIAPLCAAALASMAPALIQYSNQAKQYSGEAAATAFLVWLCLFYVWKNPSSSGVLILLVGSLLSLLLSIPSIFVVACAWMSFALIAWRHRVPARLYVLIVSAAAVCGAVFVTLYSYVYAGIGNSNFMQRFWQPLYLSSQKTLGDTIWLSIIPPLRAVFSFDEMLPAVVAAVAVLMSGFGLYRMARERMWPELILLIGPLCMAVAASLIGRWPLGTRLMVFAAPLILACVCKGLDGLAQMLSGAGRQAAICLVLLVFLLPALRYDFYQLRHPAFTDNREVIRHLAKEVGADTLYIYSAGPNGALEWLLYSENWSDPDRNRIDAWLKAANYLEDSPPGANDLPAPRDADMIHSTNGRREVIGLNSGTYADSTGYHGGPPAPGWAESEVKRILSANPRKVYVFAPHYRKPALDELFLSLQRHGFRLAGRHEGSTRWFRFERP